MCLLSSQGGNEMYLIDINGVGGRPLVQYGFKEPL